MNELKKNLEYSINEIIETFEKKQGLTFDFFVSDDCIGIAHFGDILYFNVSDICYDIFTNQPKGLICHWLYDSVDNKDKDINYKSYCMGLRFEDIE